MGSPSVLPVDTLVDFLDSHYWYVRTRILTANPQRQFGGIVEARDWPLQKPILGAFYCLKTTDAPLGARSPGENSWTAPTYTERIQWAWTIIGTDIQPSQLASNRGDRYRQNAVMIAELLYGMFPGFCEKQQYSSDAQGNPVGTPYIPKEMIWFSKPEFSDRIDTKTGILFASGLTIVTSFTPQINS